MFALVSIMTLIFPHRLLSYAVLSDREQVRRQRRPQRWGRGSWQPAGEVTEGGLGKPDLYGALSSGFGWDIQKDYLLLPLSVLTAAAVTVRSRH